MILLGYHHVLSLESRSGRARGELGRYDLELVTIAQAASQATQTAYSPHLDLALNQDVKHALEQALLLVETYPGTEAEAFFELPDGRRAIAQRKLEI